MKTIYCLTTSFLLILSIVSTGQTYNLNSSTNGTTVTSCNATIFDSGGPGGTYQANEDYVITICSGTALCMNVQFVSLSTELNNDYIQIYDGSSAYTSLMATVSGTSLPAGITTTQNCVTIKFHSNATVNNNGFQINVTCGACPVLPPAFNAYCPNANFSMADFTNWQGFTGNTPSYGSCCPTAGIVNGRHTIINTPGTDANTGNQLSVLPPGLSLGARLGNNNINGEAERLRYSLTVNPSNSLFLYKYAVVMEDPAHTPAEQPKFEIKIVNAGGTVIDPLCGVYSVVSSGSIPGFQNYGSIRWKDWTRVGIDLSPYMGQTITIEYTTYDCDQGGHYGYAYLSCDCMPMGISAGMCSGDTTAVLTAPPGFTYLWSPSGATTQSVAVTNPTLGDVYSCVLTAPNGCTLTLYDTIMATQITANFQINQPNCSFDVNFQDLSTINQGTIGSWFWNFGDGNSSTDQNPIHTYTQPGTYTITLDIASSIGNCPSTTSQQVVIDAVPQANAGPDSAVCVLSYTLQATPSVGTGSWAGTGPGTINFQNSSSPSTQVTVGTAGAYNFIWSETTGPSCTSTDTVVINFVQLSANFQIDQPACTFDANFQDLSTISPGTIGSWSWNFGDGNTSTSQNPSNTYILPGTYNVTLNITSAVANCPSSATQQIAINAIPQANAGPDNNVCAINYTLQAVPSVGTGAWTGTGPGTVNFQNGSVPNTIVTVGTDGTYTFTWTETNVAGCTSSDDVILTFYQQPVANAGPGGQVCTNFFNLNGTASVGNGIWTASPSAGVNFGSAITPATNVTVTSDGIYIFTWTENNNGCISADTVQVIFTTMPFADAGPDTAYCQLSANLQATTSVGTGSWSVFSGGSLAINPQNSPTANITASITGIYTLVWTENNGYGCIDSDTVTIQLTLIPTSAFTASPIPCNGNPSNITYTGTGTTLCTYSWDFGGGTANPGTGIGPHSVTWPGFGTQTVSLTVTLNGCASSPTSLNILNPELLTSTISGIDILCYGQHNGSASIVPAGGTPSYQYLWSNNSNSQVLQGLGGGTYIVTVTDYNGCTTVNSVTINEPDKLIISANPNHTVCYGHPAYLNVSLTGGTGPTYTYLWSNLMTSNSITVYPDYPSSTYGVTVTDANGCTANNNITVSVSPPISIELTANNDSVCPGEPIVLNAAVSGGVGPPFTMTNQNGDTVTNPIYLYPESSGFYWVSVTDNCGTTSADTLSVFVLPLPAANAFPDSIAGCQPFTVHFNEVNPEDGRTFEWNFGDNANFSLAKNPVHTYTQAGTFNVTLTVTSQYGCKAIYNICTITVWPKPNAQYIWTPQFASVIKPLLNFTNMTTGAISYMWTFGDGDSTNTVHPVHRFPGPGTWPVELIAISNMGCRDTVMYPILIQDDWTFYVPSAFTPDGDNKNDLFFALAHGIKKDGFYLAVYDRWGEVIWETDIYDEAENETEKWDGRAKNNKIVQVGTYTWLAIFKDYNGINHEKTGSVTVVR